MEEHDNVSDLKIGGQRQELSNTAHAPKHIVKTNEMSQIGKVSQSFLIEGKSIKTELLGQEVKPLSSKLDLNTDAHCEKRPNCVAEKRSGLDLNVDAVSTCFNDDLSSVCSSNVPEEKDTMKLWKEMKQNGFLSNPHSGISAGSRSYLVSSSHGGIPAPRKRGRRSKNGNEAATMKKRKLEISKKEEIDRFARLAAPSGLLNELNPAIINHVRNKKQVLSIIENIVKSEKVSGNFYHSSMRHSYTAVEGSRKNLEDTDASRSDFNHVFKYAIPEGNYSMQKCIGDELSEQNNTVGLRFQIAGKFSENANSLSSEDTSDLNCDSVLTVKAATVASQWLELLHQDIKGRVSALRRSKKRVHAVVKTELPFLLMKEFPADHGASMASSVDIHKTRWISLFNQFEHTLSEEEKQLESWLNQVTNLQSQCNQGLQHLSSGQNFWPVDSRAADVVSLDKDLMVRAAAASIYSTCNFLATKENLTCT